MYLKSAYFCLRVFTGTMAAVKIDDGRIGQEIKY
jgi:hypothetical protein